MTKLKLTDSTFKTILAEVQDKVELVLKYLENENVVQACAVLGCMEQAMYYFSEDFEVYEDKEQENVSISQP